MAEVLFLALLLLSSRGSYDAYKHTMRAAVKHAPVPCCFASGVSDAKVGTSAPRRGDGGGELKSADSEVWGIIDKEWNRQFRGIELIASENFASSAVMEALGSCMTNKYSEGLPGARYYGGNEYIDQMEILCQTRAMKLFNLGK